MSRAPVPVWKKLLFSLVATGTVLLGLEVVLRFAGVERLVDREDPFRGFSGLIRVFEPDGAVYRTRAAVAATFNDQSFAREKPPGGIRIFTLGGSSAYGFPWGAPAAFTAILGDVLAKAHPGREVEAVNAAGVSYAMHRLNLLADEVLAYDPDVLVIYSGHNEFIEPEFFDALKRRGVTRNRMEFALAHSRVYSSLHALIANARADSASPSGMPAVADLDTEVRRDRSRRFTAEEKAAVVDEYRFRLQRLVRKSQARGVRVVLLTVPANLRDWRPDASILDAEPGGGGSADWLAAFGAGRAHLERGEFGDAADALHRATELSPGHAEAHFLLARAQEGLGEWDHARVSYALACDLDASPSRRISAINDAIRQVAGEEGALLVDADRVFEAESEHGLVGFDLVEDYVHPTLRGHEIIAWNLWQAIEGAGWLGAATGTSRADFDSVIARRGSPVNEGNPAWLYNQGVVLENQGSDAQARDKYRQALAVDPAHGGAMGNLARLLVRHGFYDEARPLAERLVADNPERPQFALVLGVILLNQGEPSAAREQFEAALARDAGSALAHHNLGRALELLADDAGAQRHFETALAGRPDLAVFHQQRGMQLFREGDLVRAKVHLRYAAGGAAPSADVFFTLGLLESREGNIDRALSDYEAALRVAPSHVGALVKAAWISATAGDPRYRDASRALAWAERAADLTRHEDVAALDTLAAANAVAGRFDEAVRVQTRAIELAPRSLRAPLQARLAGYVEGRPYVHQR